MNKHIVGFILFNLIVGTSIIIAAFFYQIPKFESVVVAPITYETYTHSCWKMNKSYANNATSVKVTQAIYSNKTEELKTELFIQSGEQSLDSIKIALHFFVKNGDFTRYLGTEDLTNNKGDIKGIYDMSERKITKATFVVTSDYQWLSDLDSSENLYVMPELITEGMNRDYTPVFYEANATPVTLVR